MHFVVSMSFATAPVAALRIPGGGVVVAERLTMSSDCSDMTVTSTARAPGSWLLARTETLLHVFASQRHNVCESHGFLSGQSPSPRAQQPSLLHTFSTFKIGSASCRERVQISLL